MAGLTTAGSRDGIEEILSSVERAHEEQRHQPGDDAEHAIGEELMGAHQLVGRNLEGRKVAEEMTADHRRRHRGDDDGRELGDAEVAEDDLDGEECAGHRGVEGGGDPGRGAAADQGPQASLADLQPLPDGRSDGGADLDDGALSTHRSAGGDADPRGDELGDHHPGSDPAARSATASMTSGTP